MKNIPYIFCLLCLLIGCKSSSEQKIPELILSYTAPTERANLSNFTDQLRIIPLETPDSALIPANCNILMGEKYIIVGSESEIHQFTYTGKYVRKLVSSGRGPGEYLNVLTHYLDEKNERYFLTDSRKQLLSFDLQTGQCLNTQTMPFGINQILTISGDTILCSLTTIRRDTCPYTLCRFILNGPILEGLKDTITDKYLFTLSAKLLPDGKIRLKTDQSDTIYTVNHFQKTPYWIVKGKYSDPDFFVKVQLQPETSDFSLFRLHPLKAEFNEEGYTSAITAAKPRIIKVDKHNYSTTILEDMYIDTLKTDLPFESLRITPKNTYFTLSAFRFLEIIEENRQQLSPELLRLSQTIQEDSNPLIFIGKSK